MKIKMLLLQLAVAALLPAVMPAVEATGDEKEWPAGFLANVESAMSIGQYILTPEGDGATYRLRGALLGDPPPAMGSFTNDEIKIAQENGIPLEKEWLHVVSNRDLSHYRGDVTPEVIAQRTSFKHFAVVDGMVHIPLASGAVKSVPMDSVKAFVNRLKRKGTGGSRAE